MSDCACVCVYALWRRYESIAMLLQKWVDDTGTSIVLREYRCVVPFATLVDQFYFGVAGSLVGMCFLLTERENENIKSIFC